MSTKEGSIHLIDALSGEEKKKLYAKADGTATVKFTHHEACVLVSAERNSCNDVRYLCTYDNRYLQRFHAHSERITSISMSPLDDCFLTAAADSTVCLWNLSAHNRPIAKLKIPIRCEHPFVSFDESGLVFGVMCQDAISKAHQLKLYDARNYDAGPFQDILPERALLEGAVRSARGCEWSPAQIQKSIDSMWGSFEFSSDGNHILVNSSTDLLLILDGFRSDVQPLAITSRKNDSQLNLGSCLAPNSKHLLTATEDNEIALIDYKDNPGSIVSVLTGHVAPVGCIRCNPKYDMMATGCVNTVLWIPSCSM